MSMIHKESKGDYQIGIWSVRRQGHQWTAQATGPGTIGDGSPHDYPTLAAAYLALTGEPLRNRRPKPRDMADKFDHLADPVTDLDRIGNALLRDFSMTGTEACVVARASFRPGMTIQEWFQAASRQQKDTRQ